MIVRKKAYASDMGDQLPAPPPAVDSLSSAIDRLAREEDEAVRRGDWSTARGAVIKRVNLQETRARVIARRWA